MWHYCAHRMANICVSQVMLSAGEEVKLDHVCWSIKWYHHFSGKNTVYLVVSLPGRDLTQIPICVHPRIPTRMFRTALIILSPNWNCHMPMDSRRDQLLYVHTLCVEQQSEWTRSNHTWQFWWISKTTLEEKKRMQDMILFVQKHKNR